MNRYRTPAFFRNFDRFSQITHAGFAGNFLLKAKFDSKDLPRIALQDVPDFFRFDAGSLVIFHISKFDLTGVVISDQRLHADHAVYHRGVMKGRIVGPAGGPCINYCSYAGRCL